MRSVGYRRLVLVAAAMLILAARPAAADCAGELTGSQQSLERTRAAIAATAGGSDAQKCAAQRRHYAAMVKVREVFSRCDTSAKKANNAAQLTATIDDFKAKMPRGCRP
jgi:uncharacterized protein (DUF2141 family)